MSYDLNRSAAAGAFLLALLSASAQAGSEVAPPPCSGDYGADPMATARCQAYISGFLEGALLTDNTIVEHVTARDKTYSSFSERAFRTRVGTPRDKLPDTYMADFCLPADSNVESVVTELAARLAVTDAKQATMAEAVYDRIKADYPCDKTATEG